MRTLVIGGTGLISGAITRQLKRKGHHVTVFHRGHRPLEVKGVAEILGDRSDRPRFEAAMQAHKFDAVFDLISFNADDTASALRAFKGQVKHFVHCSTVCAVGAPLTKIPSDESEPYQPVSNYGRGKAAAEKFLLQAWKKQGFPVTIVRPSHTYGPGAHWVLGTFVDDWDRDSALINRIRSGKPVLVQGDGEQLWQSCYVDDIAEGFVGILGKAKVRGQIYNMCGPEVFTWNEYYRRVARGLGKTVHLEHLPTPVILAQAPEEATYFLKDIAQYHGAYSNAKALRDIPEFRPRTSVEQGTAKHVAWLTKKGLLKKAPLRIYEDKLCALAKRLRTKKAI
jgi:nucleoside-diphosphate-sugar epimerase